MINSLELGKKVIKDKIPLVPKNPGVYRMISASGEILSASPNQYLSIITSPTTSIFALEKLGMFSNMLIILLQLIHILYVLM